MKLLKNTFSETLPASLLTSMAGRLSCTAGIFAGRLSRVSVEESLRLARLRLCRDRWRRHTSCLAAALVEYSSDRRF